MVIDLATIDFCPGSGRDAVINELNVTENGTYRASAGVDGFSPVNVNVAGGGLTPSEQEIMDSLDEDYEGLFNSKKYVQYYNYEVGLFSSSEWNSHLMIVDGDLYTAYWTNIYKFNKDTLVFDKFLTTDSSIEYPLWFDNTGRLYSGTSKEINVETGEVTTVDLNTTTYTYISPGGTSTIWKGHYGIYNFIDYPQKFDEENKRFVDWNHINVPSGYSSGVISQIALYNINYNGHIVTVYFDGSEYVMLELKEYEDHIDIEVVEEPYFPIDIIGGNFNTVVVCGDDLYYLYGQPKKLIDGVWTNIHFYNGTSGDEITFEGYSGYKVIDSWLVGYMYQSDTYRIMNLGDTKYIKCWTPAENIAVDLKSDQTISGQKKFSTVSSTNLTVLQIVPMYSSTNISLGNNRTQANNIDLNVSGLFTKNGNNVVTSDMVILNSTDKVYGPYTTPAVTDPNVAQPEWQFFMKTHTGRVITTQSGNYYELTSNGFTQVSGSDKLSFYNINNGKVVTTPNNTFYVAGITFLWNDTTSNFEMICTAPFDTDYWSTWWDGTNLRSSDYKLVYDNSTWEWVSDPISNYKNGMYHYVNSNVYCLGYDSIVYQYDPSQKTYEALGYYHLWDYTSFVCDGDIIYPYNNERWEKIDFSKIIASRDNYITDNTGIPYDSSNNSYNYAHYEFDNKLFYMERWNWWRYCYGVEESVPEVPSGNGTYVLQATRVGDQITYEWVSNTL